MMVNLDDLVKSHECNYRWLSKKVHIQGVVFIQERGYTCSMPSVWKKYYNAVDGTLYDAINRGFPGRNPQVIRFHLVSGGLLNL